MCGIVGVHSVSKPAKLTTKYTYHSIGRSTTVSQLDKQGFSVQEIILLTGHKNVEGR